MEHKGIRYAVRIGIARGHWQVAIYFADKELPEERTVVGTRHDAEIAARSIIDAWLKKRFRRARVMLNKHEFNITSDVSCHSRKLGAVNKLFLERHDLTIKSKFVVIYYERARGVVSFACGQPISLASRVVWPCQHRVRMLHQRSNGRGQNPKGQQHARYPTLLAPRVASRAQTLTSELRNDSHDSFPSLGVRSALSRVANRGSGIVIASFPWR
jgi:hypothetical protein